MPTRLSDAQLMDLFLATLREAEVSGHRRVFEVTGVPRNTYYRMERGEAQRLNFETRGKMERYLVDRGAISLEGEVIGVDVVDELIRALSHPAVRGFLGNLSAQDRIKAALAYADARDFTEAQRARVYRWAAQELGAGDAAESEAATAHHPSSSPTR